MRIVHISIKRFRGARSLDWAPPAGPQCLVGAGDSGKTTILEAIELAFLPRNWYQFVEADFFNTDTTDPIEIEVTVVGVADQLLTQDKFGLEQRGWTTNATIRDEPEDDDEPALTVRLRVDDALEPSWQVISDRNTEGKGISARDREMMAVARIGDDVDRQLSWMRGSSLTHATGDPSSVGAALTEAHRKAREAAADADFPQLREVAEGAGDWGVEYGAKIDLPLDVGVDPRQLAVGGGALVLRQSGGIPERAVGLGSKRLLALAIQRQVLGTGVVTLVDEIEYGLEPHRLLHLLNQLRESDSQVIMTTHSETAVADLGCESLGLVLRDGAGEVRVLHPSDALQSTIRSHPDAMLGKKVVVCEGATEWGIARELIGRWDEQHDQPLAWLGTVFVRGGGSQATQRAREFKELGFPSVYWGDSDVQTKPTPEELKALGVDVIVWDGGMSTEERVVLDVPEEALERLWEIASEAKGETVICSQLAHAMGRDGAPPLGWAAWRDEVDLGELRVEVGKCAKASGWYKTNALGRAVGEVIWDVLDEIPETDLAAKLNELEGCAYGD